MPSNFNIRILAPNIRTKQVSSTARKKIITFSYDGNVTTHLKDQSQAPETPSEERQSKQNETTRTGKARTLYFQGDATEIDHVRLALEYVDSKTSKTKPRKAGLYIVCKDNKNKVCNSSAKKFKIAKKFMIGGHLLSLSYRL